MYSTETVRAEDPQIAELIDKEIARQRSHLELVASENWVSPAVLEAMGSPLTNKYAEGYPGHRYYGGCSVVDEIETLAIERLKELFGCDYANVQPHSGAQANQAVLFALLEPGDTFMGMGLDDGGHLTHGSGVNMSGKYYNAVSYGVDENGYIDYDAVRDLALKTRPKLIIAGASAYPREIDFKKFREIADACGAVLMVDMAHIAGLVAAGEHPSPFPYADIVTTTTHKTLRGPRGGVIMATAEAADTYKLNKAVFPGNQGGPLEHVIAAKAVCFKEALAPEFKAYGKQVRRNARALAEGLKKRGVKLLTDGTDNHLLLIDLRESPVSGKELETRLDAAHITANKNSVPNDPRPVSQTSGLRLGTPAVTTRGLNEADMDVLADCIAQVLADENAVASARARVQELTDKYPLAL